MFCRADDDSALSVTCETVIARRFNLSTHAYRGMFSAVSLTH